MISTTRKWKTKEDLQELINTYPKDIYIDGWVVGYQDKKFSGYGNGIKYKYPIKVHHSKEIYYLDKQSNGRVIVY